VNPRGLVVIAIGGFIVGAAVAVAIDPAETDQVSPTSRPVAASAVTSAVSVEVGVEVSVGPTLGVTTTVPASTSTSTTVFVPAALAPPTAVPEVDAQAYLVYDVATATVIAERNADQPVAVGSLIKLLTAYVVMQAGEPERRVTVPSLQLDPEESQIGLIAGEVYTRAVLMRAMLIVSANDAARTLAIDVGGTEEQFVAMMNAAARELGLGATVARNPTGLDVAGQQSNARDVLTLAVTLMADPTFRATVSRVDAGLHGQRFPATNDLLRTYQGADGIKTGRTTTAGYCLAGAATRNGRQVFVIVLGSSSDDTRVASSSALLDWAFSGDVAAA
jgi:serine-type D-Ala-D-Ala carboxypeptidase (penicillin-binding protein 5/6)